MKIRCKWFIAGDEKDEQSISTDPKESCRIGHPRRGEKPEFKQERYRRWMSWLALLLIWCFAPTRLHVAHPVGLAL